MREPSNGWSEWARQGSNLRPLGDQRSLIQRSIVRAEVLSPAHTPNTLRAEVRLSRSKTDDKVTVDHARHALYPDRSLGQRLTDTPDVEPGKTFVRLGFYGKGGYILTLPDDDGWVEVIWDSSSGWTELVQVSRLTVPADGPDYRPAHLRDEAATR